MEDRSVFDLVASHAVQSVQYGDHPDHVMDVTGQDHRSGHPVALLHGGYWRPEFDRTYLRPLAASLAHHVTVYNVEYRRVPGHPAWQFDDVCSALAHICSLGSPPVVVGHSAGGHLALLSAIHRPELVYACLAIAPITDLCAAEASDADGGAVAAFLGSPALDHPELDPARLPRPEVDYLIVHGTRDIRVPVEMSHDYGDTTTQDVGHFEWVDPRTPACALVIDQVRKWAEPAR
jgi:acetyl esterase/lipase